MSLMLELPPQLAQELENEAEREGVSPAEHATFLLHIVTALLKGPAMTPFEDAVRAFIARRSVDPSLVGTVFEELIRQGLNLARDEEKSSTSSQPTSGSALSRHDQILRAWRNGYVHQPTTPGPIDTAVKRAPGHLPPDEAETQDGGRAARRQSAMGKYAHVSVSSDEFAREKQQEIAREDRREI